MRRKILVLMTLGLLGAFGIFTHHQRQSIQVSALAPTSSPMSGEVTPVGARDVPHAVVDNTASEVEGVGLAVAGPATGIDRSAVLGSLNPVSSRARGHVPSEDSLIIDGRRLDSSAAFRVLASDSLDAFLRQLEGGASPTSAALAFDYREGVMATLPSGGAQLRSLACGSRLCAFEAWFPDQGSLDVWSETAFGVGRGALPRGVTQLALSSFEQGGVRYRSIFAIDGRVNTVVMPPRAPRG